MNTKDEFLSIIRSAMKGEPSPSDLNFLESIAGALENAFQKDSVQRKREIDDLANLIGSFDEGQSASSVIRKAAQRIDELEAQVKRGLTADDKLKLRSKLEAKKDEILRARNSNDIWAIEFTGIKRAASAMMTTASILTGGGAINTVSVVDDLDITVIRYPNNFIIDAIGGRQVDKVPDIMRWKEQNTESDGVPALTAEGATKPLTDSSFVWKTASRKKYAGRIEFTEELAMDFDQLLLKVIEMFEDKVIRAWNNGVQNDILAWTPNYTTSGLEGFFVAPGVAQVIQAGRLAIENVDYDPDIIFINPVDAAKAKIHQNANGDLSYLTDEVAFAGLQPFITTKVAAGTIVIGTSSVVKEQHSNFIVRRGVHGSQFIENEETIVGEVFSLLKLPTESKKGWVKMTVATVMTALTKA